MKAVLIEMCCFFSPGKEERSTAPFQYLKLSVLLFEIEVFIPCIHAGMYILFDTFSTARYTLHNCVVIKMYISICIKVVLCIFKFNLALLIIHTFNQMQNTYTILLFLQNSPPFLFSALKMTLRK